MLRVGYGVAGSFKSTPLGHRPEESTRTTAARDQRHRTASLINQMAWQLVAACCDTFVRVTSQPLATLLRRQKARGLPGAAKDG